LTGDNEGDEKDKFINAAKAIAAEWGAWEILSPSLSDACGGLKRNRHDDSLLDARDFFWLTFPLYFIN
jgi:hypothetical protein